MNLTFLPQNGVSSMKMCHEKVVEFFLPLLEGSWDQLEQLLLCRPGLHMELCNSHNTAHLRRASSLRAVRRPTHCYKHKKVYLKVF